MWTAKRFVTVVAAGALAGCGHTPSPLSFAPPPISIDSKFDTPTRDNAVAVADLHIKQYEEAQQANADARQAFEVPAIVALIGGVAATAFGGARDGVLVAGTANSTFRAGNAYYAPQSKAGMYAAAIVALYCVRRTAQGSESAELINLFSDRNSAENVIHRESIAGIWQIRSTLTSRLSAAGSYSDVAGIAADYEKSMKSQNAAKTNATASVERLSQARAQVVGVRDGALLSLNRMISEEQRKLEEAKATEFQELIQQCTLRAKA